ncbi:uncharacterized protein LOC127877412 isoform X4 [Dreissena polymorpha]|uniref:uncharacterized protein LOC127877412 isoform X2 n=1 Tax=Dreissena polymorpha TaxID=45954 RepID=UPI0022644BB5|nr:uncharacterized protein LOC127877412 isoform X2 [Dreissena polymorpha]XP_052279228.1 uncharacterized protein LOC127877412 isoform X4 [Dreissena polymorpha]
MVSIRFSLFYFVMEYRGRLIFALCVAWIFHVSGWPCLDKDVGIHRFGDECSRICHCRDNEKCGQNGTCQNGCAQGMFGPGCQYVDIARNFNTTARHSTSLKRSSHKYAKLAVDLSNTTCSSTLEADLETGQPWWKLWFPYYVTFTYNEFHVDVKYAANVSQYRVSVANLTHVSDMAMWSNESLCYETQGDDPPFPSSGTHAVLRVFCKKPVVGNSIRIELLKTRTQLVLCDVYVSQDIDECAVSTCKNGARCVNSSGGFNCMCAMGWQGTNCDEDIDECAVSTCKNEVRCNNSAGGYKCTCATGWQGTNCDEDIDECAASTCKNRARCDNTAGWYKCTCATGWQGTNCDDDIDECAASTCKNRARCDNSAGGYKCTCATGWQGINCDDDIDECAASPCKNRARCNNSAGGYKCTCATGWQGTNCDDDIDECAVSTCKNRARCDNSAGGYKCTCATGWQGTNCDDDIDECAASTCKNRARCDNSAGGYKCTCATGWQEINCDDDIDECAASPCKNRARCNNSAGGYKCTCATGWQGTNCDDDIDECAASPCKNRAMCDNSAGGYKCTCRRGWQGINCDDDIDECAASTCKNRAMCDNSAGGYKCTCATGWQGTNCDDDIDECAASPCKNRARCNNSAGGYKCTCATGWQGTNCEYDIDECAASTCKNRARCDNSAGGYKCTCATGWKGTNCDDDFDECAVSTCKNRARCDNSAGGYKCTCRRGWQGINCDYDIDECAASPCKNRASCNNSAGGYKCTCATGWQGTNCDDDIDECAVSTCKNGARCDNSAGGYTCTCATGWQGTNCGDDIDECAASTCKNRARCDNSAGGYKCTCATGWQGINCGDDIDECAASTCKNRARCDNSAGGYKCTCATGWQGINCDYDIDECDVSTCEKGATCVNFPGEYSCTCALGWRGNNCDVECEPQKFGQNCSQNCSLNCEGLCDHVTGHCSCKPGYSGQNCTAELSDFPVELVSGGSTGMLILLFVLIIIIVVLIRNSKAKRENERSNAVTNVSLPNISIDGKSRQDTANHPETEQNSLSVSAETPFVTILQEAVYSNMLDLPPVESSGTTIALTQLQGYVRSKSADEPYFALEFKKIPYGLQHPNTTATATVNAGKNRYKDTYAYDHSRVVLNTVDGNEGSDYINACFIEGFCKKRTYIASQGPTEAMMDDFWRMIWQYDVSTVVMVTNLKEMGKIKCLRYWPLEVGSQKDFQALTTTLIFNEEFTDYTVRKFKLSHKDKPSVSRVVTHFHYTAWPDKDVPASTSSLLHFWRRIRAHDPDKKQPWVVHCSAGVGRTGTFIAMDILIDEGQARQTVDIYACVTKLRQQRVNMVQTAGQYKFLHRLMVEYLTLRSQFVSNNEFANYQNTLLQVDQKQNKTGLFLQYETEASYHTLELPGANIKGDEGDPYSVANMPENAKKNRFNAILPNNRYRAMLTVPVDGRNDFINAVFMPSYKVDNKYILTQKPLSNTVVDCWRLIESRDISLVVTFPDEGNEQNGRMFPTTGSLTVGPFNIMFITEHHEENYFVSRVFKVQYMKKERTVTQLLYQKWHRCQMAPPNVGEFLMLMDAVEKRTKSSTALIQCLDGATRSGLLLVLLYATECMSKDGEVSMPMVIRHLRTRRPQLIPNFEQYRFCYSLLTQYVESNVTYANT